VVGSSGQFGIYGTNDMVACGTTSYKKMHRSGPWINVQQKYLGLKFLINGQTHYGWARFTVHQVTYCKMRAELTGYAYESDANTPIVTGQTSDAEPLGQLLSPAPSQQADLSTAGSLGDLALGAPSLAAWMRKEDVLPQ
jgi:hypothetical protein